MSLLAQRPIRPHTGGWPPGMLTQPETLSRADSTATLARAGWTQVCALSPCAPHRSRFDRVPGGWRPRIERDALDENLGKRPWESQSPQPPPACDPESPALTAGSDTPSLSSPQSPGENEFAQTDRTSLVCYEGSPPIRRPRREPQLSCRRWTARVQQSDVCKKRVQTASCLELAHAMTTVRRSSWARKFSKFDSTDVTGKDSPVSPSISDLEGPEMNRQTSDSSGLAPMTEDTTSADIGDSSASDGDCEEITQMLTKAEMDSRRHSRWSVFSSTMSSRRNSMMEEAHRETYMQNATRDRGHPEVLRAVQDAMQKLDGLSGRQKLDSRETMYAEMLVMNDWCAGQAAFSNVSQVDFRDLAALFSEYDGTMRGFVSVPALRSLLRRMGHFLPARDLVELISQHWSRHDLRTELLDLMDILEIFGLMQAQIRSDIRILAMEMPSGPLDPPFLLTAMKALQLNLQLSLEQLRRTVGELGVKTTKNMRRSSNTVVFDEAQSVMSQVKAGQDYSSGDSSTREEQMTAIVERLRQSEKIKAQERAGFTQDEAIFFQKAYERTSRDLGVSELLPKDLIEVLADLGIVTVSSEEQEHLEDVMRCVDRDDNGAFSFTECLHLVRRLFDEAEVQAVLSEKAAAEDAGLPEDEVPGLREVFDMLKDEETDQQEFNYFALTKAVRLFGGTLSVAQSTELEKIYQRYAEPSKTCIRRKREKVFQLTFPSFLRIVGELWSTDFAGILTSSERWMDEDRVTSPSGASEPPRAHLAKIWGKLKGTR